MTESELPLVPKSVISVIIAVVILVLPVKAALPMVVEGISRRTRTPRAIGVRIEEARSATTVVALTSRRRTTRTRTIRVRLLVSIDHGNKHKNHSEEYKHHKNHKPYHTLLFKLKSESFDASFS